jgi:CBS-domain-containing membrane protein
MDAVHAALDRLVTAGCNSLPIVDERGTIVDAFSRSDVIGLENFGVYDLTQTLQDALGSNRTPVPICQMTDTVGDIVAHFVATGAKDMFVVDAEHVFQGQISAEELLHFLYRSTLSR